MNEVKFQAFWDRISICWTDRDFQSWVNHIALPFTLITRNGQLNNDFIESLKKDCDLYRQALDTLKIPQIIRKVTVIEVSEEDTLIGSYQTQMFAGDRRVVGRYTSSAMLDYDGKTWWISSIMNALGHRDWATREHLT
ncbi:MAG: hypothetical protein P8Q19_07335 [Planktomarina sp.]|nr:hypothetical protein [Planktomarina sp.]